jgi:hypothetical protein
MKNINLYGNVIRDTIFIAKDFKYNSANSSTKCLNRYGGLCNIVRAINLYNKQNIKLFTACDHHTALDIKQEYNVDIEANFLDKTAHACVIEHGEKKTSIVNWGDQNIPFLNHESQWNHISYLDNISNIQECSNLTRIHSADLCSRNLNDSILSAITNTDYLVISDHEFTGSENLLIGSPKKGLVVHYREGCTLYSNNTSKEFKNKNILNEKQITGAGDTFLGIFIINSLYYNKDINKVLEQTINATPVLLQKITYE